MMRLFAFALGTALVAYSGTVSASHAAATCPAFPAPTLTFSPIPSPVERDLSQSARLLAAKAGYGGDKTVFTHYDADIQAKLGKELLIQKQPDGTNCLGVKSVTVLLGLKRAVSVASDFQTLGNACVIDAVAAHEDPLIKADDAVIKAFGEKLVERFAADFKAIGTVTAKTPEEGQAAIGEKISAIFNDKIIPAFENDRAKAIGAVDLSGFKLAPCDGKSDEVMAKLTTITVPGNGQQAPKNGTPPANASKPPMPYGGR